MASKKFTYTGKEIEITYDLSRCIHAAECIHGAPAVFDPARKPWIDPDADDATTTGEVIHRCPSGALSYVMADATAQPVPATNSIKVDPNGPLYVRGNIEVKTPGGEVILRDTRVAFCRCGLSKNKPFCDNSHIDGGFASPGTLGKGGVRVADSENAEATGETTLTVIPQENASLTFIGPVTVVGSDGEARAAVRTSLCRCGHSANAPFCDKSHKEVGFVG